MATLTLPFCRFQLLQGFDPNAPVVVLLTGLATGLQRARGGEQRAVVAAAADQLMTLRYNQPVMEYVHLHTSCIFMYYIFF